jgi:hypothetical protein
VTSQGSPYARFRRAIERDNVITAEAAARELGWLSLPDALAYCLLLLGRDPARYRRAALRWHARWEKEVEQATFVESQLALASLAALGSVPDEKALKLLQALAEREGRRRMKTARRAGR